MDAQERQVLEKTASAVHADVYDPIDTTTEMERMSRTGEGQVQLCNPRCLRGQSLYSHLIF